MFSITLSLATLVSYTVAASLPRGADTVWQASNFNSLITFGDSYTDENRLNYFASHNGSAPPAGTFLPESFATASGGKTWPRYVVQYAGSNSANEWDPKLTLYNYAVSGAVCSNEITPRTFPAIKANFPSVLEYELPAFLADLPSTRNNTTPTTAYFTPPLAPTSAAYALWIGTNDLGIWAFLTNSQVPGTTIPDYMSCVFSVLDGLYASGARAFVLMNAAPLHLAPLYANATLHGAGSNQYWPLKNATNATQVAETMHEAVANVNALYRYRTPYEALVAKRYPGASFAVFDVGGLLEDVYTHPNEYLNGTEGADVQGFEHRCSEGEDGMWDRCELAFGGGSPDSFMWYDELHPSTQTDRVIAREFLGVLDGGSRWAEYW
ncbi:uncharacterized protein HMPREF1541_08813 [Cyphellophora europaea CBS 101466]|uniref:SGNH hydrolase-type esterase domain-containing protein n=1 Tax=Cyphellophora europaea (strain CBS 101466) TaxID=1220924 RepID=W2RJL3_CYPE1|nr:uncharacterized protein HMPREF1541_08813 [Cyphellophora europaea CBS 101466]ETN36535.1 hypothetical protein HMPREF1541_08813 [Cyphellophora europaea CBS 101466]